MSLINDALKRAKLAPKKPAPPVGDVPRVQPGPTATPAAFRSRRFAPATLAAALAGGALFAWLALRPALGPAPIQVAATPAAAPMPDAPASPLPESTRAPGALPSEPPAQPARAPVAASSDAVASPAAPLAVSSAQPGAAASAANASGSAAAQPPAAAEPAAVPASPALPKLQGILYRAQRPAALLNGKMVLIGGMVGQHRVVAISPHAVTLVCGGQTNVLAME
jgi:hypothetical protein